MEERQREIISFTKVKLPYGWLGNMSAHPVFLDGQTWFTAEHAFQALRLPEGHQVRAVIQNVKSPMMAKMMVKPHRAEFCHDPGTEADLDLMRRVLRAKLDTNPLLWPLLEQTGTATIIEDVSARNHGSGPFWGAARVGSTWVGQNWLGRLWMEIREGLEPAHMLHQG